MDENTKEIDEEAPKEPDTVTQPLPVLPDKMGDLSPEQYAELQLSLARQQRREAQAEQAEIDAARERRQAEREAQLRQEQEEAEAERVRANTLPVYDFKFTFMNMFSFKNVLIVLFPLGFAAWFAYVLWQDMLGVNVMDPTKPLPDFAKETYPMLLLMFLTFGVLNLVTIIVHCMFDRLSVKDGSFVYTPPRIPWLLMFGGEKSVKQISLRQAATADFQQNPVESIFNMDSTSFVLDSAAKENQIFKKLRGVPHSKLLKQHIAQANQQA